MTERPAADDEDGGPPSQATGKPRRRATRVRPDGQRPVGIVDVAARAGVSQATVSRALHDHPGVSSATRVRVEKAAAELGYAPSAFAAALARGRSNTIAVVAPWISRWFFATVIEGVHEVVADHGYDLLLHPLGPTESGQVRRIDALALNKRVDGIIGLALPHELRVAGTLRQMPIFTVGTSTPGIPGVQVDDSEVGYIATRHLLDLGHRRIAFLGLDPDDIYGFNVADDRYTGYCRAIKESAVHTDPDIVLTTGFLVEAGEAAFLELLTRVAWKPLDLPTAVVCVSDEIALGVIYAARQWGIRVPQDLSVVGVDNHDMARLFDLTTVSQPVFEQGRIAATMLVDIIESRKVPEPELIRLAPGLIIRDSTAPPRVEH